MGIFGLFHVFKWESEVDEVTHIIPLFKFPIFKERDSLNLQMFLSPKFLQMLLLFPEAYGRKPCMKLRI